MHHPLVQLASADLDKVEQVWGSKPGKMHLPLTLLTSKGIAITWRSKVAEVLPPLPQLSSPGQSCPGELDPQKLHALFLVVFPRSFLAQRSKVGKSAGTIHGFPFQKGPRGP